MKRRTGAIVLAVSLVGLAGVANADTSSDDLGPGDKVPKCHLLGNGSYIYIEPSASSYVTAGHGTRNDGDVFETFSFRQNRKSDPVDVIGTTDPDLLAWVGGFCQGDKPGSPPGGGGGDEPPPF